MESRCDRWSMAPLIRAGRPRCLIYSSNSLFGLEIYNVIIMFYMQSHRVITYAPFLPVLAQVKKRRPWKRSDLLASGFNG